MVLLSWHPATAQTTPEVGAPDYHVLPTLTVVAPARIEGAVETASAITHIGRQEPFESHKSNLDPVLRGQPGVALQKASRGSGATLQLRGATGGLGQILLDDMPLFNLFAGFYNPDAFAPEMLGKVEVLRGAAGPRYGAQALGGVIRLFSREARQDSAFLDLRGGSFGTLATTAGGGLVSTRGRVTMTGRHEDVFEGVSLADERNGNREPDGLTDDVALLRYSAEPTDPVALDGTFYYASTRADIDGLGLLPDARPGLVDDPAAFGNTETWLTQHTGRLTVTPRWESSIKLGFTQLDTEIGLSGLRGDATSRLFLARWQNRHELLTDPGRGDTLGLSWGAEGRHEEGEAEGPGVAVEERRAQVASVFELDGGSGNWQGYGGVRVDGYDDFGTRPVFYLGLAWQALATLKLRTSGGSGYRIPTFAERFTPFFGEPTLEPEESRSVDLGIDLTPIEGLELSATAFYNRYDDLINQSLVPAIGLLRANNVRRAELSGLELEAGYEPHRDLSFTASYTYLYSRNLDTGLEVAARPPHQWRIGGEWRLAGLPPTLGTEAIYRSASFSDAGNTVELGDAFLLHTQASYRLGAHSSLYLRAENLTDDRTEPAFSVGSVGRGYYGGVRWEM